MSKHPPRTANTMSEAIAMSSPSGRTSKRARKAAEERLRISLFGHSGPTKAEIHGEEEISEEEKIRDTIQALRRNASCLRNLADKGMQPRKHRRIALERDEEVRRLEKELESRRIENNR